MVNFQHVAVEGFESVLVEGWLRLPDKSRSDVRHWCH